MKKHLGEILFTIFLLIAAFYSRIEFPYASLVWLVAVMVAISFFMIKLVTGFKINEQYRNKGYSAVVSIAFIWLFFYSLCINFQPLRMLMPAGFFRFMDVSSVMISGFILLLALSNLSRIMRNLRKAEQEGVVAFYKSMVLRIAVFSLILHLPEYRPVYFPPKATKYPLQATEQQGFDEAKKAVIFDAVQDFMLDTGIKGLSGYVQKGENRMHFHAGYLSAERNRLPRSTDIYQFASISKTLTATLMADMLADGKLDTTTTLNDVVQKATLSEDLKPVRLLDLATHYSGLARLGPSALNALFKDMMQPYRYYTQQVFLEDLAQAKTGNRAHQYSNFGFGILGYAIIERERMEYQQGRGLLSLMNMKFGRQAGMEQLGISNEISSSNRVYAGAFAANGKSMPWVRSESQHGKGQLIGSLNDLVAYANYYQRMYNESDSTKNTAYWAWKAVNIPVEGELHQHLGWLSTVLEREDGSRSPSIYWHNGATYGSSSFIAIEPTSEIKVILLSNTAVKVDPLALDLLKALLE